MSNHFLDTFRLPEIPLLSSVPPAVSAQLAPYLRPEQHVRGTAIFRQGDPASSVCILIDGFVKLVRVGADGDETVIDVYGPGQTIGESLALIGGQFGATGEAVTHVTLARLPAPVLARAVRESMDLALAVVAQTHAKLQSLMDEIQSLKAQSADQRVASFILSMCPPGAMTARIQLPYGKRLIAERLGLEQATLSRSFANLRSHGVRVRSREVEIANVAALAAASHGPASARQM